MVQSLKRAMLSQGKVIPVQTVVLKKKELANTINVTGNILANEVVNLQPEIAGKITRITFKEGEGQERSTTGLSQ